MLQSWVISFDGGGFDELVLGMRSKTSQADHNGIQTPREDQSPAKHVNVEDLEP